MADGSGGSSDYWLLLPEPVRRLPADLAATVALVSVTVLSVLLPVISETPLRVVFGLPFVLFLPGYAFIAALFPETGEAPNTDDTSNTRSGIDGIERVALSFGLSIAIVPLIGLILNFTPWGIRLVPILLSVSAFTLIAVGIAAVRRWELPEDDRFRVPYRAWVGAARSELFEPESRSDAALNVLLAVSILLAVASVGYAIAVPKQGESFTELYLLTENEDGLVAADYPTEFVRGESRPLVVGIGNHEHRAVEYTVVALLQEVRINGSSTARVNDTDGGANMTIDVIEQRELRRFSPRLGHNETWLRPHNVTPTMTGDRLRLAYVVYDGSPPPQPNVSNAYREVHLWVNVSESPE